MNRRNLDQSIVASEAETRLHYLKRSKREFAPIRRSFVQRPPGKDPRHGPLAEFVRTGNKRALNALLFILRITSSDLAGEGWRYTLDSRVWARALGTTEHATQASALTAVSRTLDHLYDRNLILWDREGKRGREITVTLLREDGTGDPYTRPGKDNADAYIRLVDAFWKAGWDQKLSLPGIAMLLVSSAEYRNFALPTERVPDWYGWSADTAERGFHDLRDNGLITWQPVAKKAPNLPRGWTEVNNYTLRRPFKHRGRGGGRRNTGEK